MKAIFKRVVTDVLNIKKSVTKRPQKFAVLLPFLIIAIALSFTLNISQKRTKSQTYASGTPVIAQDYFTRPNQTYWGTATDGNVWGAGAGTLTNFSIVNNTGQVSGASGIINGTLGPVDTDSQVFFTGSTSSFNGADFGVLLRYTNNNNWYKAYIDGANLLIRRMLNGNNSVLVQTAFPASPNTSYSVRFQAVGSTLSARAWPTSGAEPTNWMIAANDSNLASGYAGVGIANPNANTILYTSFTVTDLTTGVTPTPTVTPLAVTTSDYTTFGADPWGTAFDKNGNVWVALPGCDPGPDCPAGTAPGKIGVFNPSTKTWTTTYQLPAGYGQAIFLALDASGNVWFPMFHTNTLGMLNPSTGAFQEWTLPTAASGPWDIAIDHNGKIWITEHYGYKVAEFDPVTQTFINEIATTSTASIPYGITVDATNNIWFTENSDAVALIAEYTSSGQLREYKIRNSATAGTGLTPHLITIDPSGNIWWSEGWVSMIGKLNIAQATPGTNNGVTEYAYPHLCPTCATHTSGISVDKNGLIWFDDALQSEFGSFTPSSGQFAVYNTPTANSHPHDGLNVDSVNNIWFDEEFANKLALGVQNTSITSTPTPTSGATSTPTPTAGATPTPTPSTAPTPTMPAGAIAQDTFQRPNQTHWGTASDGHAWTSDAATNSIFSITNNTGQVKSGSGPYNAIIGSVATNAQVLFTGTLSSFSGNNIGSVLRWNDTNNWYKAYIDGSNLVVQKKVKGTATTLATFKFAATANTNYSLRFQIVGSALSAKVWATGTTEPAGWMVNVSDSALASGYCGLRMQVASGVSANYTSFTATAL